MLCKSTSVSFSQSSNDIVVNKVIFCDFLNHPMQNIIASPMRDFDFYIIFPQEQSVRKPLDFSPNLDKNAS